MAEMATIAVFGLSLPWLALSLAKPAACNGLLAKKRVPLAFAALGTAGSLLLLLAGINLNWIALVAGGTCAGAFMAAYQLAWGRCVLPRRRAERDALRGRRLRLAPSSSTRRFCS